jgi:DNA-binding beta-propeller fold protein YncE
MKTLAAGVLRRDLNREDATATYFASASRLLRLFCVSCICVVFSGFFESVTTPAWGGPVYYSDYGNGTINRINVPGGPVQTLVSGLGRPWGITVDPVNQYIYYGIADSANTQRITRSNLDGSNPVAILSGGNRRISSVELDVPNNWLYFVDGNARTINRIHLNGTGEQLLATGTLNGPLDVEVDAATNSMYWTQIISTSSQIFRSNLDGTNTQLLFGDQGFYYDLAVDPAKGFIYFADQHPNAHAIRRINLDGTNPVTIVAQAGLEPSGLEIDFNEGRLYWSRRDTPALWRANLDGSNPEQFSNPANFGPSNYTIDLALGPVPEPGSWVIASLGILGIVVLKRLQA